MAQQGVHSESVIKHFCIEKSISGAGATRVEDTTGFGEKVSHGSGTPDVIAPACLCTFSSGVWGEGHLQDSPDPRSDWVTRRREGPAPVSHG